MNKEYVFLFSEIVDILSEKCKIEKEEVKEKYETFQKNYPEGEITKDEFLQTMSVRNPEFCSRYWQALKFIHRLSTPNPTCKNYRLLL